MAEYDGGNGDRWPGDQLGLPENGPGSMAPFGRRVLALFIDWGIAMLIGTAVAPALSGGEAMAGLWALGLFALMHILLVGTLGVTIGKRIVRIQVVRGTQAPGLPATALRTALLLLVIPAFVMGPDGRSLHDRTAGTVQLRM